MPYNTNAVSANSGVAINSQPVFVSMDVGLAAIRSDLSCISEHLAMLADAIGVSLPPAPPTSNPSVPSPSALLCLEELHRLRSLTQMHAELAASIRAKLIG